jgi:hypothetical protein
VYADTAHLFILNIITSVIIASLCDKNLYIKYEMLQCNYITSAFKVFYIILIKLSVNMSRLIY